MLRVFYEKLLARVHVPVERELAISRCRREGDGGCRNIHPTWVGPRLRGDDEGELLISDC